MNLKCEMAEISDRNKTLFKLLREGVKSILEQFLGEQYTDDSWKRKIHEKSGDSVIHVATKNGHLSLVKWLVEIQGLDPGVSNHDGKQPLHDAAQFGFEDCVEYIISQKFVNVDCLKRADWTPLMLACTRRNKYIVEKLINAGADLKLKNKDGWTAFHIACREGCSEIVTFLLDCDSHLWDTISKNGRTPLHTAALHGHLEVIDILLVIGEYSSDQTDSCGSTPLMDALRAGYTEVAKLIITKHQADVTKEDTMGRQPIHQCAQVGSEVSVKFLVHELGIDVSSASSKTGITALHLAAKEGQCRMVELLCLLGADVQEQDNQGRTALYQACGGQHVDTVRTLLTHGAIDEPDKEGKTARQLAKKSSIIDLMDAGSLS